MLRGDLSEFTFPAMLQMLLNGGRSGHLRIQGILGGELWLDNGEVIFATSMTRTGAAALELLSCVDGGEILFEAGLPAPARNMTAGRDATLRQIMVDEDAWKPILQVFPDWNMWLRFSPRWSEQQPVNRLQYRALALVGRLSLREMVERSDLGARRVLAVLLPFVQAGLVEVVPPPTPRADS
jgi:Domain of unknown function (DUF4388)